MQLATSMIPTQTNFVLLPVPSCQMPFVANEFSCQPTNFGHRLKRLADSITFQAAHLKFLAKQAAATAPLAAAGTAWPNAIYG